MSEQDFNQLLKSKWAALFESKDSDKVFVSNFDELQMKPLDKNYIAYFNKPRTQNKPHEPDSFLKDDSNEETKSTEGVAKAVYKEFDENQFNFNSCNPAEVLFYVNLDEEEVISKEKEEEIEEEQLLNEEEQLDHEITESENQPIIVNIAPVCPNHCIIPLFPQEQLPQTIGQDIILLLLQVFKISQSPELRIGYNSLGGCATINHLHFQLCYADDLFPSKKFPIEQAPRKLLLKSTLQNPKEDINMYSVGMYFEELIDYPVRGLVIRPTDEDADFGEIYTSMSYVAGTITNILLEKDIAHNLIFSDKGRTIYIIPRQHESVQNQKNLKCGFFEIGGLAICRNKEFYDNITAQTFEEALKKEVSLSDQEFESLKKEIIGLFEKNFQ